MLANLQGDVGGSYASELSIINVDADEPEFRTLRTNANDVQEFENCDQMLSVALNSTTGNAVIGGIRPLRDAQKISSLGTDCECQNLRTIDGSFLS